jgi:hypothetical protein
MMIMMIMAIDVAIPSDRNVIQKETENKTKDVSIQIQRLCSLTCFATPVITGATENITEPLLSKHKIYIWKQHKKRFQ